MVLLSEYGITRVDTPIHLNRLFREQGWLTVKEELGRELIDFGNSKVFAVADHQIAHIYLNDRSLRKEERLVAGTKGVDRVVVDTEKSAAGISMHAPVTWLPCPGKIAWLTYYYWTDDQRAPDFARTVDIHRKPGYDPSELFIDPALGSGRLRIAKRLLQKKLGMRMLMDVVPLDASLVKGSHGARPESRDDWPVVITQQHGYLPNNEIASTDVYDIIKAHLQNLKDYQ